LSGGDIYESYCFPDKLLTRVRHYSRVLPAAVRKVDKTEAADWDYIIV